MPGNPRGGTIRCICPGSEGGRRRASSVVADLPRIHRSDHAARATLGRRGRPRRPEHPGTVTASETVAATAPEYVETTLHRGVPGTALCRYDLPAAKRTAHKADAGQPPRRDDPVHLFRFGRRPPAPEQRGRRYSNHPPHDHAARATLGRQGRPRRPGLREALNATPTWCLFSQLAGGATRSIVRHRKTATPETTTAEQCNTWHPARGRPSEPSSSASPTLNCDGSASLR